jgi:hypothetical protein
MKLDIPPVGKALSVALVAVLAVIVANGLGLIGPPSNVIAGIRTQTHNFFASLFSKTGTSGT